MVVNRCFVQTAAMGVRATDPTELLPKLSVPNIAYSNSSDKQTIAENERLE